MNDFFHKNAWAIMILVGGAALNGSIFYLNTLHSAKGEAEIAMLQFEIEKQQAYELANPKSAMSDAREMIKDRAEARIEAYKEKKQ